MCKVLEVIDLARNLGLKIGILNPNRKLVKLRHPKTLLWTRSRRFNRTRAQ